jgi:acetate kinase
LLGPGDDLLWALDLPAGGDAGAAVADARAHGEVGAAGHRFVHGGTEFTAPAVLTPQVEKSLAALTPLAPLHQPAALAGLAAVRAALPGVPQVGCFDTAFHATIPAAAHTYALPLEWRERYGLRRFGFHGLSHSYASRRAAAFVGRGAVGDAAGPRVVTCHLGGGASLAAVLGGRSVDTTMGFTPLEGLVMATRSGSVDPGIPLWLVRRAGLSAAEVDDALEEGSGLLALAGTADMRAVVERAGRGEPRAAAALDVYLHRLRGLIAMMAVSTGGLDVLVFTGGVGERAGAVRAGAAAGLGFLGVAIDPLRNAAAGGGDREITAAGAGARVLVIEAREDLEIAAGVRAALAPS